MHKSTETPDMAETPPVEYPDELPERQNQIIRINGHCEAVRQLGSMTFLRVASHYFSLQVIVLEPSLRDATSRIFQGDVISVSGRLRVRPNHTKGGSVPQICADQYEVVLEQFSILYATRRTDQAQHSDARNHHFHWQLRHRDNQIVALIRLHLERSGFLHLPPPESVGFHEQQRVRELVALNNDEVRDAPLFCTYTTEQLMSGILRFYFFIDGPGNLPDLLHLVIAHHQPCLDAYEDKLSAIAAQVVGLIAPGTPWQLDEAHGHWPTLVLQTHPSICISSHTGEPERPEHLAHGAIGHRIAVRRRLKGAQALFGDMASTLSISLDPFRTKLEAVGTPKRGKRLTQASQPGIDPVHADAYEAYGKLESEHQTLLVEQCLKGFNPLKDISSARSSAQAALRYIEPALHHYGIEPVMARRFQSLQAQLHPHSSGATCPVALFQLLWNVLGNPSAKRLLETNTTRDRLLTILVDQKILTDIHQLVFIHSGAIDALESLLELIRDKDAWGRFRTLLRNVIARSPTEFATLVTTLAGMVPADAMTVIAQPQKLENAVKHGLTTPYWLTRYLLCDDLSLLISDLHQSNLNASQRVLGNNPVLSSARDSESDTSPPLAETIYTLFRPTTAGFSEMKHVLYELQDRCAHIERAGLKRFNRGFKSNLQGYRYFIHQQGKPFDCIRMYLSKNAASFFAKSTTGICTDINRELFEREDHFHLNIFSEHLGRLVGNVQLYTMTLRNDPSLLIRGINPIKHYATTKIVDEFLDCIIACAKDIASENGFHLLCVAHQNGLWNSNSNRPEIRAALARRLAKVEALALDRPFHLYTYYTTPVLLSIVHPLWRKSA